MKSKQHLPTQKNQESFSISKRKNSFRYAFQGLRLLFRFEHNARIHLLASTVVIATGFYFSLSYMEWIVLVVVMGMVMITEIINTAIERICNFMSTEISEEIRAIKDLAAAAVMLASVIAVVTGLIVFIPYIIQALN